MSPRNRWRVSTWVSAVLAVLATSLVLVPSSSVAVQAPVILEPADGAEVALGFAGPIRIDFSGVMAGTYHVQVTAAEDESLHSESLADVQVVDSEPVGVWSGALSDTLDKPGLYRVRAWREGADTETVTTFTVAGGGPPTVLSPGRKVALGQPWTLKIDWTDVPIGYYDLDLRRVGGSGSCCGWWEELFANHEDRGTVEYRMDPITVKGKYYLQLGPWRTYFQVR